MQTTHYWWSHLQLQSKLGNRLYMLFRSSILQDHLWSWALLYYGCWQPSLDNCCKCTYHRHHERPCCAARVDSPLFREGLPNHVEDIVTSMAGVPLRRRRYVSTCILKEDCSGDPIRAVVPTHYWIKHGRQLNSHASTLQQEAKSFIREPHTRPPEQLSQVNQHVWLLPRSKMV